MHVLKFQPAPTMRTTSKRKSKIEAVKAMELAAKDEAEDAADIGMAEEEEEGPGERQEQGPSKAPAKKRQAKAKKVANWFYISCTVQFSKTQLVITCRP